MVIVCTRAYSDHGDVPVHMPVIVRTRAYADHRYLPVHIPVIVRTRTEVTGKSMCSSHGHGELCRSISCYVLVTIKVPMMKSKYVHGLRPCNANVIIIFVF